MPDLQPRSLPKVFWPISVAVAGGNLVLGISNDVYHHLPAFVTLLNFAVAGAIVGMSVRLWCFQRTLRRIMELPPINEIMYATYEPPFLKLDARVSARRNLERVMQITQARYFTNWNKGGWVQLTVGPRTFHITPGRMYDGSRTTCWQGYDCPWEEQLATVLLLLKSNPALFDFWADNHGMRRARL